jgi:hypothetical protein
MLMFQLGQVMTGDVMACPGLALALTLRQQLLHEGWQDEGAVCHIKRCGQTAAHNQQQVRAAPRSRLRQQPRSRALASSPPPLQLRHKPPPRGPSLVGPPSSLTAGALPPLLPKRSRGPLPPRAVPPCP